MILFIPIIFSSLFFSYPDTSYALEPDEILVVANRNSSSSAGLAGYYMQKRKIPEMNLVLLWVKDTEGCTREDYEKKIIPPVRRFLQSGKGKNIRCIVTVYGVPLKISPPEPEYNKNEQNEFNALISVRNNIVKQIESNKEAEKELTKELEKVENSIRDFKIRHDKWASLDSELSLIKKDKYDLALWQPNPYFLPYKNVQNLIINKEDVMMVSRLDGPDPDTVKRVVDDSIIAEKSGLSGNGYFDARWEMPESEKKVRGYALYDKHIHMAAEVVEKSRQLKSVVINANEQLFQHGECPESALYCGWYSLANYIDAFTWVKGSVGYHIASSECATLKASDSNVWCKRMLEKGIAVTIGPVGEPYVESFPDPLIFFSYLLDGHLELVECYYLSLPFVSWKMVLIGDPLYQPFKNRKALHVDLN